MSMMVGLAIAVVTIFLLTVILVKGFFGLHRESDEEFYERK